MFASCVLGFVRFLYTGSSIHPSEQGGDTSGSFVEGPSLVGDHLKHLIKRFFPQQQIYSISQPAGATTRRCLIRHGQLHRSFPSDSTTLRKEITSGHWDCHWVVWGERERKPTLAAFPSAEQIRAQNSPSVDPVTTTRSVVKRTSVDLRF